VFLRGFREAVRLTMAIGLPYMIFNGRHRSRARATSHTIPISSTTGGRRSKGSALAVPRARVADVRKRC
jgi:hypothetical protein